MMKLKHFYLFKQAKICLNGCIVIKVVCGICPGSTLSQGKRIEIRDNSRQIKEISGEITSQLRQTPSTQTRVNSVRNLPLCAA